MSLSALLPPKPVRLFPLLAQPHTLPARSCPGYLNALQGKLASLNLCIARKEPSLLIPPTLQRAKVEEMAL